MVIGLFFVVVGLTLAVVPLPAARLANMLRFVPYSKTESAVRYYRLSGLVMAAVGIIIAALLR